MVDMHLSIPEVALRLLLAMVMGGAIGYERQYKSRPAGLRTHILVCMGACVIALIQVEIATGAMRDALDHPDLAGVIRSDEARLIAQVVSGVGFLMGDRRFRNCHRDGLLHHRIKQFYRDLLCIDDR